MAGVRKGLRRAGESHRRLIGELLVEQGIITAGMLRDALELQKKRGGKVVEVLISMGYLDVDDFVSFLSGQPGVASIDLSNYHIPHEITDLVSEEYAIKHEIFPIDKMGRLLTLGMVCPLDTKTIAAIEESTGLKVKPLLCSPEDIREAVKRYYGADFPDEVQVQTRGKADAEAEPEPDSEEDMSKAETGLKLKRVTRLVRELNALPALPETVNSVREAMDDLMVSPRDVAQTIIKDPPIAAKVLSVANSAAYGFQHQVDTIELAVALLGLRETYSIVMSAAVMNLFTTTERFDYRVYWEEAMNCAAASRIIANACGRGEDRGIFTAGLLHDIGRIALLEAVPEGYAKVSSDLTGEELIQAEQHFVGLSHTEAGFELASNWNFPPEIAEPIRFHHNPEFSSEAQANVVVVALAEQWTRTGDDDALTPKEAMRDSKTLLDILSVSKKDALAAFEGVAELDHQRFKWDGHPAAALS